jgi:hypothetical protein
MGRIADGSTLGVLHRRSEGGKILHQCSPLHYVKNLKPLANTKKRHIFFESPPGEGHLKAIKKGKGLSQPGLGLFSPEKGSHIPPSGEDHSVHPLELLIQGLSLKVFHLREYQGYSPRLLHRPDVVIGDITADLSPGCMGFIASDTDNASLYHGG